MAAQNCPKLPLFLQRTMRRSVPLPIDLAWASYQVSNGLKAEIGAASLSRRDVPTADSLSHQRYAAYALTQRRIVARNPIGPALSEMTVAHHSEPKHVGVHILRNVDARRIGRASRLPLSNAYSYLIMRTRVSGSLRTRPIMMRRVAYHCVASSGGCKTSGRGKTALQVGNNVVDMLDADR